LQNKIASLQLRLGKREDAEKSLRSALEMYGRSRHLAQQAVTASEKNLAALGKLGLADCRVAFVSEQLGDLQQSLRSWQAALSNAELLVKSDPNVAYSKTRADIRRSQVVRLQWLLAGDKADYRPILGEDATPRRIREQLAIGWRNMAVDRETVLAPISLRFEAIGKAVALDRELVAEDPQVAVKRSLALDLQESALFHGAQSIHTDGAEQTAELEKQRAALVESRQILNSLRKEGTLPKEDSSVLVTVSNSIEGVEAQLRALQASR